MNQPRRTSLDREHQLYAEVAEAVNLCLEAGRLPDVDALVAEYPHLAGEIRRLVPLVATLHQLGNDAEPTARPASAPRKPTRALGRIGEYRILREIASGGMGIVYEAQHTLTGKRVALKVLPFQQTLDPRHVKRFKIGGYVARQLNHRNIVPVYEVGRKRGVWYQVMRYVDGPSLAAVIEELRERVGSEVGAPHAYSEATRILAESLLASRHAPRAAPAAAETADLSDHPSSLDGLLEHEAYFRTVAHLGLQAAEALEYLHSLDHVHRDVKPANLLWERGRLWLTDFGLVRRPGQNDLTGPGELVGTLRYMSPEQVLGLRDRVSRGADIYGLGVTLYELLTLEPAFPEPDPERLKYDIVGREPRRPRRWNSAIPIDLETIVLKAMAKSTAERYPTAQELADDLRRFLNGQPVQARRPTPAERLLKWARRHQQALLVCLMALTLTTLSLSLAGQVRLQEQHQQILDRRTTLEALVSRGNHCEKEFRFRRLLARDWTKEPRTQTAGTLERLLQECEQVTPGEAEAHPEGKRSLALCYLYATFRYRLREDEGRALEYGRRALELLTELNTEPYRKPLFAYYLAATHNELGQLHLRASRHQEAERSLRLAQAQLVPLVAHFRALPLGERGAAAHQIEFTCYRYELAASLLELGNLLRQAQRNSEALPIYGQTIALFQELVNQPAAEADYQFDLAGALNNLGLLLASTGEAGQALKHHQTAHDTLGKLVAAQPERGDYVSRLGTTLVQMAVIHRAEGKLDEVCTLLEAAAERHETAVRLQPAEGEFRSYLSDTLMELASTQVRLGRHAPAAGTARRMVQQFPDEWQERYRSLAVLAHCVELAERDATLAMAERQRRVDEYTTPLRGHLRTLTEQGANDPAIQNELAWFLATCPVTRFRDPVEAVKLAQQAVDRDGSQPAYWNTLGVACYRAAQWKAAQTALERAAQMRQGGSGFEWLFLAMTHWQLGQQDRAREYHGRALRWLEQHKPGTVELHRLAEEAGALVRPPAPAVP